nr:MFS transporter [Planosporangium flavigriseum]
MVGVLLVGLNLRPAVTSLGAVLEEVQRDLHFSGTGSGFLTALPVLCFALVGAGTPLLLRRFNHEKVVAGSLTMLVAGLVIRPFTSLPVVFAVASALSLAGIAIANVVLPGVVKEYFPDRAGPITGMFSAFVALGTSAGSAFTVPFGHSVNGGWRAGLGLWAAVGALGLAPWVVTAYRAARVRRGGTLGDGVSAWRSPRAWALMGFWALQSAQAYVLLGWLPAILQRSGHTPGEAGWLVALMGALGAPVAFAVAVMQRRRADQRVTMLGVMLCYAGGYVGLLYYPGPLAVLWMCLLGLASGAFPLMLSLLGTRSATPASTHSLSAFVQSTGYLLAGAAPVVAGWLSSQTASWRPLLIMMMLLLVPQTVTGMIAAGPWVLDREVRNRGSSGHQLPRST